MDNKSQSRVWSDGIVRNILRGDLELREAIARAEGIDAGEAQELAELMGLFSIWSETFGDRTLSKTARSKLRARIIEYCHNMPELKGDMKA